ncbi:glycoside hydrolase family 125 protein [Paenibacillus rhizophilus]|uniref:Metal-independent alpha-mannosidase n=2 Tax=Paenibacillus rhizophilus TaxID=1850366 RepID=A0A3N9P0C1_9BACL|nr:glycoside hydrolase family 125 protein [Paenibacillus rhizophilus]RQW09651.1 metal-independent alpha-mannosidase [Paenibacillus rhizophilus]
MRLPDSQSRKPLDVGCGQLSASIGEDGCIRSVNHVHPRHGFITLEPAEPFPNDKWYDSEYVRLYRRRLIDQGHTSEGAAGFGIQPKGPEWKQEFFLALNHFPLIRFQRQNIEIDAVFIPFQQDGQSGIIEQLTVTNCGDKPESVPLAVGGTLSLHRCSYGQLTEGGPIPIPPTDLAVEVMNNRLTVTNLSLPAQARLDFFDGKDPLILPPMEMSTNRPVKYMHETEIHLKPGESRELMMVCRISVEEGETDFSFDELQVWKKKALKEAPILHREGPSREEKFIVQRNIDYILTCCSIPVGEDIVCIITDHQLLPLSWNRDSYYMMRLLLDSERHAHFIYEASYVPVFKSQVQRTVKGHLLWMFEKAVRPSGYWGRAYLTNGFCKDNVFQLDQQCYPLLELCEYYDRFEDHQAVARILPKVNEILNMIMEYKDMERWLFQTGETPADDEVTYPYHFSSQVLVWHTLTSLAKLNETFSFTSLELLEMARSVKRDTLDCFVAPHGDRELFAYLSDLKGSFQLYHDANDLPTVYAPIWGFCNSNDPRWMNTIEFAFSKENKGGFYDGKFGGLGSVHTPHPWPLGDGQELLYSLLIGDVRREQQVQRKLAEIVQWDGLFPEAVNEHTGDVESRHWFSWPGAFISSVFIQSFGD